MSRLSPNQIILFACVTILVLTTCVSAEKNTLFRVPLSQYTLRYNVDQQIETPSDILKLSSTVPISNNGSQQFYGSITAGSNSQSFSMVFDTTSSITYLPNLNCRQCFTNPSFYCSFISSFSNTLTCDSKISCESTGVQNQQQYGFNSGYSVKGTIAQTLLGTTSISSTSQNFLLVDESIDLPFFQVGTLASQYLLKLIILSFQTNKQKKNNGGVLALGMTSPAEYGGVTFIEKLYNAGNIPQPIFSFYIAAQPSNSELVFGGYDDSKMSDSSKISYHNTIQTSKSGQQIAYWSIAGQQISFGDSNMQLNSTACLIDSSSTNIQVPRSLFTNIVSELQTKYSANYNSTDQTITVNCNANMPSFLIDLISNANSPVTYTIPSSLFTKQKLFNNQCLVLISPIPNHKYPEDITVVLGTTFLVGYTSIFNLSNKQIGFSISIDNTVPNQIPWLLIAVFAGAGIVLIVGIISCIRWKKRKNREMLERRMQLNHEYQASFQPYHQF